MKKLVSLLIAAAVAAASVAVLAGCGDKDYPVEVANYKIESEPENVVVLDDATADIMSYIGYDRKFAGRSAAVDQEKLSAAPLVGTTSNPDVDKIVELKADVVFSNDDLTEGTQQKLEEKGIKVIKLQRAQTAAEVKTNYETIGKILGGKISGAQTGLDAYEKQVGELDKQKRDIEELSGTGALNTVCYLYLDDGDLMQLTSGSYGNILMGYTNCVNVAVNVDQNVVEPLTLASANPDYIFYDDEATLAAIQNNDILKKLQAVKDQHIAQIPLKNMSRPGFTAVETLKQMIDFIYNGKGGAASTTVPASQAASQPATQAASGATTPTGATQPATQAASGDATQPATAVSATAATEPATKAEESVADKYKIKLSNLSLKKEDENDNVKAMQQRLYDLGYVDDKENVTGYYGELTEKAVKSFQKKNGIKQTGTADNATLTAMFMTTAKKA